MLARDRARGDPSHEGALPTLAGPSEPEARADPALADRVACFDRVVARPTGGFDRVRYRFDGSKLVVTRGWHTGTFVRP